LYGSIAIKLQSQKSNIPKPKTIFTNMESEKAQNPVTPIVPPDVPPKLTPAHSNDAIPDSPSLEPQQKEKAEETTKFVHSAALSKATAAQKPSLFTRRMFQVRDP
jgi:hypothetical protein